MKRIHIISIGGAVMHNIAIALRQQGHRVTGSDDEIYDPSHSRLSEHGLLPSSMGWDPDRIGPEIDFCILGMHARKGNPEIEKAKELQIPMYSFPEYIARHAKDKTRIVVGGSHGKTTTTSMIMHILRENKVDFDYLVGARIRGFDGMVRLSDAPLMIIEGDEYLSSALDPKAKFLHYEPHMSILTGIAWDHMNVFPTFESYLHPFREFLNTLPQGGHLFYYREDELLEKIVREGPNHIQKTPYSHLPYEIDHSGQLLITLNGIEYPTSLTGPHNARNLCAAAHIARKLNLTDHQIGSCLASFRGADKRLQLLGHNDNVRIYLDFAHAPSKVKTTMESIKEQFPDQQWAAVSELHTYSSLNKDFLPHYAGALDHADRAMVFYSPHTLKMKKMPPIAPGDIRRGFQKDDLQVGTDPQDLQEFIRTAAKDGLSLLLMSSGTFGGLEIEKMTEEYLALSAGEE